MTTNAAAINPSRIHGLASSSPLAWVPPTGGKGIESSVVGTAMSSACHCSRSGRTGRRTRSMTMPEVLVDFITSLEGAASGDGWPGWWGLESPEYLQWLEESPERDYALLMGEDTYQFMSGFA